MGIKPLRSPPAGAGHLELQAPNLKLESPVSAHEREHLLDQEGLPDAQINRHRALSGVGDRHYQAMPVVYICCALVIWITVVVFPCYARVTEKGTIVHGYRSGTSTHFVLK